MISPMFQEEYDSRKLSQLVRLELTPEEEAIFNRNLKKILGYMALISEVDTEGVLPCAHVLETIHNVLEEDEEGPLFSREMFLKNAPDSVGGMVKVPPVIQQEE